MHTYVYFVQAGISGPIKIGYTANPAQRLKQLQTGNPDSLRMLAVVPGDEHLEKMLHRYFEPHRQLNEWFEPVSELLDLIDHAHELEHWVGKAA